MIWVMSFVLCSGFVADDFYSVQLKDVKGVYHKLNEYKGSEGTAVVFLLADCPASQYYSLTLNQLSQKYISKKIQLIGVFAGKYTKATEVAKFVKDYKINFPVLTDAEMILAGKLKATTAPEVFLLDKNANVVYSGRIDDTYYAPGRKKSNTAVHDLQNAMEACLKGKTPSVSKTKAIGCILEY